MNDGLKKNLTIKKIVSMSYRLTRKHTMHINSIIKLSYYPFDFNFSIPIDFKYVEKHYTKTITIPGVTYRDCDEEIKIVSIPKSSLKDKYRCLIGDHKNEELLILDELREFINNFLKKNNTIIYKKRYIKTLTGVICANCHKFYFNIINK